MAYTFVLLVGLAAGALSGMIGTGSSIMLLPILVYQFGPKQAVPIMAVAALMSNISKVMAWWREVDWRAFAAYSIPGVPAAALGARTLLVLPSHVVDIALGAFFLAMIPTRRWVHARSFHIRLWQLAIAGAAIGYLTGIVLSTGPLSVPAFTSYGTCIDGQQSRDLPATRCPSASSTLAGPHCWGIRHGRLICRKSDRPAHEHSHLPISSRCTALLLRSFPPLGSL